MTLDFQTPCRNPRSLEISKRIRFRMTFRTWLAIRSVTKVFWNLSVMLSPRRVSIDMKEVERMKLAHTEDRFRTWASQASRASVKQDQGSAKWLSLPALLLPEVQAKRRMPCHRICSTMLLASERGTIGRLGGKAARVVIMKTLVTWKYMCSKTVLAFAGWLREI